MLSPSEYDKQYALILSKQESKSKTSRAADMRQIAAHFRAKYDPQQREEGSMICVRDLIHTQKAGIGRIKNTEELKSLLLEALELNDLHFQIQVN
jgi:hypothetical protein